jgi:hypothetical protein
MKRRRRTKKPVKIIIQHTEDATDEAVRMPAHVIV